MSAAVLYATRLDQQVEFYQALGLIIDAQVPGDFATLLGETMELSVVQIPEAIASQIEITTPPTARESVPVKLAITVESLDGAIDTVLRLGGLAPAANVPWKFRSKWVQDVVDPEGNVIQLRSDTRPKARDR